MVRLFIAFWHDGLSWALILLLLATVVCGMTALFHRYEKVDLYQNRMVRLEYDVFMLKKELVQKREWDSRLKSDPLAWEQVARNKMNYLGPDEVLITFVSEK